MPKLERVMAMSVEQPLWRALTGYRVLTMIYAVGLFVSAYDKFERPWLAVAYYAVLAGWTLVTLPKVASAARRKVSRLSASRAIAPTGTTNSMPSPLATPPLANISRLMHVASIIACTKVVARRLGNIRRPPATMATPAAK